MQKFQEPTGIPDRYKDYPLLRATTWSRELLPEEITVNAEDVRCHAAIWNFSEHHCVSVILDRVSRFGS